MRAAPPAAAADPAGKRPAQPARRGPPAASHPAADPSLALRASVSAVEPLRREVAQLREHVAQLDREMAEMRDANQWLSEQLGAENALGG